MSLFSILVDVAARTASFESGMQRVEKRFEKINQVAAKSAKILGTVFATAQLGKAVGAAIEFGDEIGKAAVKAGVGTKAISELAYATKILGDIELPALSEALKKMQVNISKGTDAFAALGLNVDDLRNRNADEVFELIADQISQLADPAERARAAVEIFGKAGADLLPAFEDGAKGIREARMEAALLGQSMSESQVKKLQEADDAIKRVDASWQSFARTLATIVSPAVSALALLFTGSGGNAIQDLEDQIRSLEQQRDAFLNGIPPGADKNSAAFKFINEQAAALETRIAALREEQNKLLDPFGKGKTSGGAPPPGYADQFKLPPIELDFKVSDLDVDDRVQALFDQIQGGKLREEIEELSGAFVESGQNLDSFLGSGINEGVSESLDLAADSIEQFEDRTGRSLGILKDETTAFADQAARNMQSAFADFLFDPFDKGIKGMLRGFVDVIRRMVAEAAAAKLFETVFGKSGTSSGGNALGTILSSFFGGGKAEGGPLSPGKWYIAGERGPEPIWGGGTGAFAAGYGGVGSSDRSITVNVDARGASMELAKTLPSLLAQTVETAVRKAEGTVVDGLKRNKYRLSP